MADNKKKKRRDYLKDKFRIIVLNDITFKEVFKMRLTPMSLFTILGGLFLVLVGSVIILIAFTGLKEFIPGFPDGEMNSKIVKNALLVDSLEAEINKRDLYYSKIQAILKGDVDSLDRDYDDKKGKVFNTVNSDLNTSERIDNFRKKIEEEEKYNLTSNTNNKGINDITKLSFYTPVKGVVSFKLNKGKQHYGTDIVAPTNSRISSVLDGVVIFTGTTVQTGKIIQIQHSNNLVSVYKHNAKILKQVGSKVKAGEVIALLGNSGELTSGPHLHFELWHKGEALDSEKFINF